VIGAVPAHQGSTIVRFRKRELAPNERFVERMVKLADEFGRGVATPEEARQIMHLIPR
jgi:3-keto-5-aminohexanoate cleavage enzyme